MLEAKTMDGIEDIHSRLVAAGSVAIARAVEAVTLPFREEIDALLVAAGLLSHGHRPDKCEALLEDEMDQVARDAIIGVIEDGLFYKLPSGKLVKFSLCRDASGLPMVYKGCVNVGDGHV